MDPGMGQRKPYWGFLSKGSKSHLRTDRSPHTSPLGPQQLATLFLAPSSSFSYDLVTFFFQLPLGHFTASIGSSVLLRAEIVHTFAASWGLGSVPGNSFLWWKSNRALGSNFKWPLPHPYFWSSCSSRTFQSHHLADCNAHRFLYFPIDSVVFECGNILIVYKFLRTNITQSPASLTPEASYCIDCVCAFHLEHASGLFFKSQNLNI